MVLATIALVTSLGFSPAALTASERIPLGFALNTPRGPAGSETIPAFFKSRLTAHTPFVLDPIDGPTLAPCAGRLACIVRVYQQQTSSRTKPRYVLIMSYLASPRTDLPVRLAALMLDLEAARSCAGRYREDAEACLRRRAVVMRNPSTPVFAPRLNAFLRRLFEQDLAPVWRQAGYDAPLGMVAIRNFPDGAIVLLDGRIVGTATPVGSGPRTNPAEPANLLLQDVAPGSRQIAAQLDDQVIGPIFIEVMPGQTVTVSLPVTAPGLDVFRTTTIAVASVTLVAGLGISIAAGASPNAERLCPTSPCPDRYVSVGSLFSDPEPFGAPSDGVPALPLGLSLAVAGGTWLTGSLVDTRPSWWRWVWLGAGLVAGGLTYGLALAVE